MFFFDNWFTLFRPSPLLHPRKLTWIPKMMVCKRWFPLNMAIFGIYVKFLGSTWRKLSFFWQAPPAEALKEPSAGGEAWDSGGPVSTIDIFFSGLMWEDFLKHFRIAKRLRSARRELCWLSGYGIKSRWHMFDMLAYPPGDLTYPTWGKGKSSSQCHFWGIC